MKKITPLIALATSLSILAAGGFHIPLQIGSPLAAQSKTNAAPAADALSQLSDRSEAVVAKVLPAVVSVEAVKPPPPKRNGDSNASGKNKPIEESGSGVIIKLDVKPGYFVVTNNHV